MHKEMLITVGTSLYHAAMWEPAGPPAEIRGYERWTTERKYLEVPRERDRDPTARRMESALDASAAPEEIGRWVEALHRPLRVGEAIPADQAMRYCGEIATLVKLAAAEETTLRDFVSAYAAITIPLDSEATEEGSPRRRSLVAARHLLASLNEIAGREVCRELAIPGLASAEPEELMPALGKLLEAAKAMRSIPGCERVDLVVTGGFKVYGYLFVKLLGFEAVHLHYIHESGGAVLQLDKKTTTAIVPGRRPVTVSTPIPNELDVS